VTIDNVLATSDVNLSHREVGPDDGSDHRPVYVEIRSAGERYRRP
jgi:endonuclease/exonuclease/phosphatase (EEP) superfamily protein YafD